MCKQKCNGLCALLFASTTISPWQMHGSIIRPRTQIPSKAVLTAQAVRPLKYACCCLSERTPPRREGASERAEALSAPRAAREGRDATRCRIWTKIAAKQKVQRFVARARRRRPRRRGQFFPQPPPTPPPTAAHFSFNLFVRNSSGTPLI